jgi:hypothetical protein
MDTFRIKSLEADAPLLVWDGGWLPAHLVEVPLDSATGHILVRFDHVVSAPIAIARVVLRDPARHGADRPSSDLSAMMYAESLRSPPVPVRPHSSVFTGPVTQAPRASEALPRRTRLPNDNRRRSTNLT